jgi:hypothetical protein
VNRRQLGRVHEAGQAEPPDDYNRKDDGDNRYALDGFDPVNQASRLKMLVVTLRPDAFRVSLSTM